MSDTLAHALPATEDPAPADKRGSLDVRVQALQHIVETVALEVPGVQRVDGALGGVRTGSPHASVRVRGTSARVTVEVACHWPAPLTQVAAAVRERVLERASELSGVRIASVDVTVKLAGIDDRRAS